MRIMGLDYGSVTIGVALSDSLMITAQGFETIKRSKENHLRQSLRRIKEIIDEYNVEKIILGLPKNMNDTIGERAERTLEFKVLLEQKMNLPVILWDERLSTWEANNILDETDFKADRKLRKKVIDQIAAQLILEDYMKYIEGGGKDEDLC